MLLAEEYKSLLGIHHPPRQALFRWHNTSHRVGLWRAFRNKNYNLETFKVVSRHFQNIIIWISFCSAKFWPEQIFLIFGGKFLFIFWRELTGFKKSSFFIIKIRNQIPRQTLRNQILEHFRRTQTTTPKIQPHSNTLPSMTKMPHVPIPLLDSSSPSHWVIQVQFKGVESPPHIELSTKAVHRTLCTNLSLGDSSVLDWHPIFNASSEPAEKLIRIKKDWTANPPARPNNQGANPMLPNDDNLVHIEEKVN